VISAGTINLIPYIKRFVKLPNKTRLMCLPWCRCAGIAHRDLKPENILVNYKHLKWPLIKVCDFGLSLEVRGEFGNVVVRRC
jgi:serine/threonine protein kinase